MRNSTQKLVLTAMFVAITVLLGVTPLGLIPLGFINVTILCIPVIVGTLLFGLKTGLMLGACFGLCSTLSMFGLTMTAPSALAAALAARQPVLAIAMCFAPRLLVPVATRFMYKLVARGREFSNVSLPFAAAAGSLTNTICYLGLMLLFYTVMGLDSTNLKLIITGTGIVAGGFEAIAAAIITSPVVYAIWKAQHKL